MAQPDLVCISHLGWNWVWQRPQHLITRLAKRYRVFWTEEPIIEIGPTSEGFEITEVHPNIQVGKLVFRSDREMFWRRLNEVLDRTGNHPFKVSENITWASLLFGSPAQPRLEQEVRDYVASWRRGPLVLWLYSPAAVDFVDILNPDLVVYDAMDELRTFKFAPEHLIKQEDRLLSRADLVFCGGPSIHESKLKVRPDAHLFPSGVEQEHFASALGDLPITPDMDRLPRPIVGYFGVIDERIDLQLLAQVAEARPDWSLVMVGPVLKIEERVLPTRPNLHYLGKQEYEQLPAYLKAFDVAMMPFALNEATRFISPTKTLEYMAAHKPIVSTPIKDVISLYGSVVRIARSPQAFVEEVEMALSESPQEGEERLGKEREMLAQHSWDSIAEQMADLIENALARKLATR